MVLSSYFSDEEVISNLRQQFPRDLQYNIDFKVWLNNGKLTSDGYIVQVLSRKFLIDKFTGVVIKEL